MNSKHRIRADVALALLVSAVLSASPLTAGDSSADLDLARRLNRAFVEVADRASASVVIIKVAHDPDYVDPDDDRSPLLDMLPPDMQKRFHDRFDSKKRENRSGARLIYDAQGSGVVIRQDGFILTNYHVVEGAAALKVLFRDGREYEGVLRGADPQSDLAVIKIEGTGFQAAELADSDQTRVGEFAIAIGAPFNLDYSVTFGHVSAKGRHVIPGLEGAAMDQDFIQTDANINPGNSGGPLVNLEGQVIGINTLIRGLHTGIGFAIPANLAKEISERLITDGRFVRAWLGVSISSLSEYPLLKIRWSGVAEGVVITSIKKDGPASKSDLKPADVITAIDGQPVKTSTQLKNMIRSKPLGRPVLLDVARAGERLVVKVSPEEWPDGALPVAHHERSATPAEPVSLGLTVKPLTKGLAAEFKVERQDGLIVTQVERGGLADENGIRPGDIITEVDHKKVTTPKQFVEAVRAADQRKGVMLNLVTRGDSRFQILKETGE